MNWSGERENMTDCRVPWAVRGDQGSMFARLHRVLLRETCCAGHVVCRSDSRGPSQHGAASNSAACLPPGHKNTAFLALCAMCVQRGRSALAAKTSRWVNLLRLCPRWGWGPLKQLQVGPSVNRVQTRAGDPAALALRPKHSPSLGLAS